MANKPPAEDKHLEGLINAPAIYVDGYQGVSITAGVAKVNFYTISFDPSTEKSSKVAAFKLVTPLQTLKQIHSALGELFDKLEKDGLFRQVKNPTTESDQNA